ncbi:MAG: alcohol dehydrogenase catalytic domain-containing protein [Acidobacteriaceae bacterium]|nr:alcohol dehydrogenase catalytic domain-containing protein [Acidobacteriaceae bacterium]
MKAAVYRGVEDITVEDRPIPELKDGQVLLRVIETGICGTDMQIYLGKHPRARTSLVPGHEIFGKVESVGNTVTNVKPGDRVVVYPLISCGVCDPCKTGDAHVCERLGLDGIDRDGGFAEFVAVDAEQIVPVPDGISDTEAVIVEPLAVVVHAIYDSAFRVGDTALVTGAGPMGNLLAQVLRAAGARYVAVSEVSPFRRQLLERLGFETLDPTKTSPADVLKHSTGKPAADIVFEATGHASAYPNAVNCCRVRGHIGFVGIPKTPPVVDIQAILYKEIHTSSARVYRHRDYVRALAMLASKSINASSLITDRVPLTSAAHAYELMKKADTSGKIVISPANS